MMECCLRKDHILTDEAKCPETQLKNAQVSFQVIYGRRYEEETEKSGKNGRLRGDSLKEMKEEWEICRVSGKIFNLSNQMLDDDY